MPGILDRFLGDRRQSDRLLNSLQSNIGGALMDTAREHLIAPRVGEIINNIRGRIGGR
jgi:hypothetical protein